MNDVIRTSNERVVPTFEGRLFTDSERHGLAGNWVRRAEVDVLLDEIERLRGDLLLSQNAVSTLGRQRSDWKAAYEGAIQRNAHETGEGHVAVIEQLTAERDFARRELDRACQETREALSREIAARRGQEEIAQWHEYANSVERAMRHARLQLPPRPSQKAGACPPIDAKLNASIEAVAKVLQEEAASDPTFPVRGVANYAGLAGRIIRAVAGSKEKS